MLEVTLYKQAKRLTNYSFVTNKYYSVNTDHLLFNQYYDIGEG